MADRRCEREALADRVRERVDDAAVRDAIATVPRHEFVPEPRRDRAYEDRPLPIGAGQTISAPHMVGIMADLLDLRAGDRVLEIGTGCGYHAAVTAELVGADSVYSVEYHDALARQARETLAEVGYGAVSVRTGDGKLGWPEHAPYDRVYLTCAAASFPRALVEQTRLGGTVLGPIGDGRQELVRARPQADGTIVTEAHGGVRFVPLR